MPSRDFASSLLQAFDQKINKRESAAVEPVSEQRWSYRLAACVLHCFRPRKLRPLDPALKAENPGLVLAGDLLPASGGRGELLQLLKPEIRRESLQRLGTRERMLAALDTNIDRPHTDLQEMFEDWLHQRQPPLEQQSFAQLGYTLQIVEWLNGLLSDLPPLETVQARLNRRSVLSSFEHLVLKDFIGREKELKVLRDYVGVLPPASTGSVLRQLMAWLSMDQSAPLVIYGPGGIGKSALVGRFLYEHANVEPELRFPFAYLPFDNPVLKVEDPFTLILEAVSQFELQFPEYAEKYQQFHERVKWYRDQRGQLADGTLQIDSFRGKLDLVDKVNEDLYTKFGELLRDICARNSSSTVSAAPALLVFDTFEEVQYRNPEQLIGLWRMGGIIQQTHPGLRVVISGRRPENIVVNGRTATPVALGELDDTARVELLKRLGVSDDSIARAVARQVGGNPLTLRLAARVLKDEQASSSGIAGVKTRTWYYAMVSEELIRGQLYRRVLGHIHDPDVQKLAHPGMVLRRVTPAIIQEVLAYTCGVQVPDSGRAQALFEELRREHALVWLEQDGSLHYRPEIRVPMLKLLTQDKPQQVKQIHQSAVEYYSRSSAVADRAEEVYHRLILDEDGLSIAGRWMEGIGNLIAPSIEELPPAAAAWLASRMSLSVPPEILAKAATEDWERHAGRRVRDLIRYLELTPALTILGERADRSEGSPLFALEGRVRLLNNQFEEAAKVFDRGIASMAPQPNRGRFVELLWLRAQTASRLEKYVEADGFLEQAEQIANTIEDPLCRVQILTERMMIRQDRTELSASQPIRARLAEVFAMLNEAQMDRERGLIRNALSFLGSEYPVSFRRGFEAVGLGDLAPKRASRLLDFVMPRLVQTVVQIALAMKEDQSIEPMVRQALKQSPSNASLIDGIAEALNPGRSSTGSATLAGIEEYREAWELEAPREAQ
jgi:tetratricopeptide (TPR) repeat protein